MDTLGDLSDEELLAHLRGHVGNGNVWCAELIAYLVEVEERRLDRVHACSSMWDFCTRKLGMSEGEAHRRIAAARTVRRFPQVLGAIARGDVHLCALYALRKHLTIDNVDELLREASGKSTREVEKMVAACFPRPDVPTCVEPVTPQALLSPPSPVSVAIPSDAASTWSLALAAAPTTGPRPRVEPLSATRYRIELTVSTGTKEAIDRIKDLMLHRNPSGDLETILDASLALLLAHLEKERLGKTPRPRRRKPAEATNACASSAATYAEATTRAPSAPIRVEPTGHPAAPARSEARTQDPGAHLHADALAANRRVSSRGPANAEPSTVEPDDVEAVPGAEVSVAARRTWPAASPPAAKASRVRLRYVPMDLRREVFARDGTQCTYVGPDGDRCPARGYLELDHVHPKARGGTETAANLRVRCRAHNALYAEQVFGRTHVASRMDLRRRKSAPPTPASFEIATRGLRSLGFREPEARRVLETLATKPEMQAATVEMVLREALLVLT
ncbi:MAG: hypothetical protein BGO98_49745 [Myxococcales bacterium 68-20]|nr:hypothetical protein [Myxococcales bacterium]OJY29898.1 MAG: hypothetical protein BGO98_49745 [Myxococcales bacterium 68-20]